MRHGHRIHVVALSQKQRHRGKHECREREPGRERIARGRSERHYREDREESDDNESHHVVGRDTLRLDDEMALDDRRDRRDREQPEADAAQPLVGIARAAIEERRDEVDEREHRGEREKRRKCAGERLRPEEADRGRPERERSDR